MPVRSGSYPLTTVGTTAIAPVGSMIEQYNPTTMTEEIWLYVFNDEAATSFVQGTIVMRKDGTATGHDSVIATTSCAVARCQGVAQHTIPAQSFGYILRSGIGEVLADTGGISANTGIVPGNAVAGRADDSASVVGATIGFSTEAVAATALATCFINCRG